MLSRATPLLLTLIALGGCANQYTPGPLPADHPANPEAATAPAAPPSMTLAVNDPVRAAPAKMQDMDHGSGGMKHGSKNMRHESTGAAPATQSPSPNAPPMPHDSHDGHGTAPASPPPAASQPSATHGAASQTLYACPMHKEVTSTNPEDRCPKCNMKVNKPVKQATGASTTPAAPAGAGKATHGNEHGGH